MTRTTGHLPPSAPELAAVLDCIGDGVTIQDDAGRLVYANAAAALLLGFPTPAELIAGAARARRARGTGNASARSRRGDGRGAVGVPPRHAAGRSRRRPPRGQRVS